ncbi:aspartic peptidase domain-containing protein [Myxozyma melibiosi]|uniref:Aspartic peptidase domain-containing protein n=1 Tax=Myxozyma melibiosi TaxID=54550 RepID=A0ABR1FBX3_9ASCO
MKLALLLLAASAAASALPVSSSSSSSSALPVLHMPLRSRGSPAERLRKQLLRRRALRARDDTVQISLDNSVDQGTYLTTVSLGTPAQNITVLVDTGSSDLWVQSSSSSDCSTVSNYCTTYGTYSESDSSTASALSDSDDDTFSITYADSSSASGVYLTDTITVGSSSVSDFTFAVASNTSSDLGVLGIGFTTNEAAAETYENLPARLASDGVIQSNAYSLWLNSLESDEGNLLFGGIDTAKFSGELQTIDITASHGSTYTSFLVTITDIAYNTSAGVNSTLSEDSISVVLDSGTTYAVLPKTVIESIVSAIGSGTYDDDYGLYTIDCTYQDSSDAVVLTFNDGGATLSVPLSELVVPLEYSSEGSTLCAVGIQSYTDDDSTSEGISTTTYILGDAFLRAGYIVYDLTNKQISIAQAVFDTTESSIVAINSTGLSTSSSLAGTGVSSSSSSSDSSSSSSSSSSAAASSRLSGSTGALVAAAAVFACMLIL